MEARLERVAKLTADSEHPRVGLIGVRARRPTRPRTCIPGRLRARNGNSHAEFRAAGNAASRVGGRVESGGVLIGQRRCADACGAEELEPGSGDSLVSMPMYG